MGEKRRLRRKRVLIAGLAAILLLGASSFAGRASHQTPNLTPDELLRNMAARKFTGGPVTIRVTAESFPAAVKAVQKASGLALEVDPGVYEIVRGSASDKDIILANEMPWDALLDVMLRQFRLGLFVEDGKLIIRSSGGGLRVVPPSESAAESLPWPWIILLILLAAAAGFLVFRKKYARGRGRSKFALGPEAAEEIKTKILYLFEVEKIHHEESLSLQNLSAKLSLPAHHVSWVFNEVLGASFSRFVSTYRINEVKKALADAREADRTILDIAFEAGFGTKTAFNKVFKELTGMTPSEYRDKSRS